MKIKVNDLKVGDKLRFPNGDVWESMNPTPLEDGWFGFKRADGKDVVFTRPTIASILSAVEVERKPEKVVFKTTVENNGVVFLDHGSIDSEIRQLLAPFIGQEVEVEVRPLATKGGSNG